MSLDHPDQAVLTMCLQSTNFVGCWLSRRYIFPRGWEGTVSELRARGWVIAFNEVDSVSLESPEIHQNMRHVHLWRINCSWFSPYTNSVCTPPSITLWSSWFQTNCWIMLFQSRVVALLRLQGDSEFSPLVFVGSTHCCDKFGAWVSQQTCLAWHSESAFHYESGGHRFGPCGGRRFEVKDSAKFTHVCNKNMQPNYLTGAWTQRLELDVVMSFQGRA